MEQKPMQEPNLRHLFTLTLVVPSVNLLFSHIVHA